MTMPWDIIKCGIIDVSPVSALTVMCGRITRYKGGTARLW